VSHSISTLLTRNLHEVFDENDRRAAIDEIFTEDCVSTIPWEASYRSVWHLLQEEWRLLLVTPGRYSARMKL
jgi:hypothetical protein